MATLTYVYADSTAVLGPLATHAEPHTYDLCQVHAERLTAPRGWDVVRLVTEFEARGPSTDDLVALAEAVREARVPARATPAARVANTPAPITERRTTPVTPPRGGRGGHLRVIDGQLPEDDPAR